MITPNSTIKFLKVPFSSSQINLLKFSSESSQQTYMNSKEIYTMNGCKFQREGEGEYIIVNKNIDQMYNCNYVMFQNTYFSNKYFYAFIERMQFINNQITHVYLKMDSYQTFQFDYTLKDSFIDRQTFTTDYYNTLADTPSSGDLKTVFEHSETLYGTFIILFNSDPTVADSSSSSIKTISLGNYSLPCYMCMSQSASSIAEIIQAVSNKGRADRIQACYYAPVNVGIFNGITNDIVSKGDLNITGESIIFTRDIETSNFISDITFNIPYTTTFKKELSYPYAKLEVVDKITGKTIELDLSKFQDPLNPQFKLITTITDSQEYKVVPLNYNGIAYSIENALNINANTEIPVFSNSYSKYLKDNLGSNIISGFLGATNIISSASTGNVGGVIGGFANIAQTLNADQVARTQPNQCTGIKGDAFEYLNLEPKIIFRLKVMDSDHLDIARNFWKCYGYPVRKITSFSNTANRYNFIKTVNCNIIADTIPTEYQRDLESIFNSGVTIWNSNYLDYNV